MSSTVTVTHNTAARQFEAETPHGKAMLRYVQRGDVLDLAHTAVPAAEEGAGIGSALARAALEHARTKGQKVVPSCPFVRAFINKHPEFSDLVAPA